MIHVFNTKNTKAFIPLGEVQMTKQITKQNDLDRDMHTNKQTICFVVIMFLACLFLLDIPTSVQAQQSATTQETKPDLSLKDLQKRISGRYQRFSKTLTQLHGYMKKSDPARAELLLRVIGKSKESQIDSQLATILQLLSKDSPQFADVVGRQEDLINSLLTLLDVLQSEDERKRLDDEITRLEDLIDD